MINKRSRNSEGLLASRLGDQDALRKLQDRGKHGTLMSNNKIRYFTGEHGGLEQIDRHGHHPEKDPNYKFLPEQSEEATNYIKAVDRQYSGKDWDKDLGGGMSFLQGPRAGSLDALILQRESADYVDPIRMEADAFVRKLDEPLGPDHLDQRGESIDEEAGRPFGGLRDAMSGLLSSDDEEKERKRKKVYQRLRKQGMQR